MKAKLPRFAGFEDSLNALRGGLKQAQDSLKVLESLEKELLARAKNLSTLPRRLPMAADEKIVASLKSLGLATQSEVKALETQVNSLTDRLQGMEQQLETLKTQLKTSPKTTKTAKVPSSETEATT